MSGFYERMAMFQRSEIYFSRLKCYCLLVCIITVIIILLIRYIINPSITIKSQHCDAKRIQEYYMNNLSAYHLLQTKPLRSKLFEYEIANNASCQIDDNGIDLLIFITSKPSSHQRRNAIRRTYGNVKNIFKHTHDTSTRLDIRVLFFLALDEYRMKNILFEQQLFNDIVQVKIPDDSLMNTYRDLAILDWSSKHCSRARSIFKMDENVFLNPFLLFKFINENEDDRNQFEFSHLSDVERQCPTLDTRLPLLYGFIHSNEYVSRADLNYNDQSEKLITPQDEYPCDIYPNYLDNHAYLISSDARDLILCTIYRQSDVLLPLSDIYITGLLAEYLNIGRQSLTNYEINMESNMACEKFLTKSNAFACITDIKSSKNIFHYYSNYWNIIINSQVDYTEK